VCGLSDEESKRGDRTHGLNKYGTFFKSPHTITSGLLSHGDLNHD